MLEESTNLEVADDATIINVFLCPFMDFVNFLMTLRLACIVEKVRYVAY